MSQKPYSPDVFDGEDSLYCCNWEDHHAGLFHYLPRLAYEMTQFLDKDPKNVVAIHCMGGKGRAGSIVVLLLRYLNCFDSIYDAARYFSVRRFRNTP